MRLEAFMAKDGETKSFRRVFIQGKLGEGAVMELVKCVLCAPALCCSTVNAASQGRCHPLSCTDSKSEIVNLRLEGSTAEKGRVWALSRWGYPVSLRLGSW